MSTLRVMTSRAHDEPLRAMQVPSPALGPEDVRVRVRAIGVNPVDWKMREGGPLRFAQRFLGPSGPLVVGIDFAGEVVEVGTAVTSLRVGARVVGGTNFSRKQRGSYADEVVARPDQCVELPDSVSFEDAACLPVAAVTSWVMLTEHTRIGAGDRVLVLGASGGVGHFAVQLARVLGAEAVGVCSARNVALVEGLGASVVDYSRGTPASVLDALRARGPYDLVVQAVGSQAYPLAPLRAMCTAKGLVDLAVVQPTDLLPATFSRDVRLVLGRVTRERLAPIVQALADGRVRTHIEDRLPLEDAEEAHRRSRAGKVVGKLLLVP